MEISTRTLAKIVVGVIAAVSVVVILSLLKMRSYEKMIVKLQNEIAARDQTIEIQQGLYTKLTLEHEDLVEILDVEDQELKRLQAELLKRKEELLTVTSVAVKWKKAYEAAASANQTEETSPVPGGVTRKKVEFKHDFGYIGVKGYTLTDPAYAWVSVMQNRPLKISIAISQDREKRWHTYATSSEKNVAVDIGLTGVDPYVLKPRWYERIGVNVGLGAGKGLIAGAGLTYKMSRFEFGPAVWVAASDTVATFYGATFTWRPFER